MVQMTVQSCRRSLQEFPESPLMLRCKSPDSSQSLAGAPQSITEWLAFWEKDPVEILLDLGFGTEEPDVCTKIPPRFLSSASVAKGINIRVFLEAQKQRMDIERPNLYERFRQLEVLDHVTSALSSLLTNINIQQTKPQDTGRDDRDLLDAAKSRPAATREKWRRIGQLLKRASKQKTLSKKSLVVPGEANSPGKKEQPCSCADITEGRTVQTSFSACVMLGCLTQEQTPRGRSTLAYPTSQCSLTPLGKTWASSHLVAKQPHLSSACEVPAKNRQRKEPPLLVTHTLKKVADLNCKLPDSFEMEEIQSFEDETSHVNAPDTTSAEMTRTSSCQSDSSGFLEELPEPVVLQNAPLSENINFISDTHNQETALSHSTEFLMLNQDFQKKPNDCVAKVFTACKSIFTVPGSTEADIDQGEETHLLLLTENGRYEACNAEPQSFVQEVLCAMDRKEDKTGRKQVEKEECIEKRSPFFQSDTEEEGDSSYSKFDHDLCFRTEHKEVKVSFAELIDINPEVVSESKIRGEDEGERCLTEKDIGVACCENAHEGHTECIKGSWWDMGVASKDDPLLVVNGVTNRQKFYKTDGDLKSARYSCKTEFPDTPRSATSRCSPQVSWRHPSCLVKGPELNLSEDQEIGTTQQMLDTNESEQEDTVQNNKMASAPLKSVTVQMSSGLELTSRAKQKAPFSETFPREDPVYFSEGDPLTQSDSEALKDSVKQTTESSSQTDIHARIPRWTPLVHPSHTHLTKSAFLDTVFCDKYRSHYWVEASGTRAVQGSHCCCWCCYGCCPWTSSAAVSPQRLVGCCSNHAATELQLLKTLMLLQDTAMHNLAPCTLHEIEAMKSSCQRFQEKLDEIEQHLIEQQVLFSSAMPDEGREEGRHLQLLRRAVRQEVAELEFWLNDQACQVRESILMQLDQLLVEQSHLFSELGLSNGKGEGKAQNKQALPDAADIVDPQSGCSKLVLQQSLSRNSTATGSLSSLQSGPSPTQFPIRETPEPNSIESDPQKFSTTKNEIKGPPEAKMGFKAFLHNLKKSF